VVLLLLRLEARATMKSVVPRAPTNALTGSPNSGARPMKRATATPKDAPELMPKMKGSAMGLRNAAWKTAPLSPRIAPVRKDERILGSLS